MMLMMLLIMMMDANDDNDDSASQPIAAVRVDTLGQSFPHNQVVPLQACREEQCVPSENIDHFILLLLLLLMGKWERGRNVKQCIRLECRKG